MLSTWTPCCLVSTKFNTNCNRSSTNDCIIYNLTQKTDLLFISLLLILDGSQASTTSKMDVVDLVVTDDPPEPPIPPYPMPEPPIPPYHMPAPPIPPYPMPEDTSERLHSGIRFRGAAQPRASSTPSGPRTPLTPVGNAAQAH